jgi:hypothetical protein
MKVSKVTTGKASGVSRGKKNVPGKGAQFAEQLSKAAGTAETSATAEVSAPGPIESMLALQEVSGNIDEQGQRKLQQYGEDLLDQMEDLRCQLLTGSILKDDLAHLAGKMRAHRRETNDPNLNKIIDEIELRTEVEIAKLTREA